jgi:predicted transcriptional regulator
MLSTIDSIRHTRVNVLISIKPKFAEAILGGTKKYELRRRLSNSIKPGSNLVIYCTSPVSAIAGMAIVESVVHKSTAEIWKNLRSELGVSKQEFENYFEGISKGFAISLSNVRRVKNGVTCQKLISEVGVRPPQSFMFLKDEVFDRIMGQNEKDFVGHKHSGATRRQRGGAGAVL